MLKNKYFIFSLATILLLSFLFLQKKDTSSNFENNLAPGFFPAQFSIGKIIDIQKENKNPQDSYFTWNIKVELTNGKEKGKLVGAIQNTASEDIASINLKIGEKVVIQKSQNLNEIEYSIYDNYRIPRIVFIALIFILLIFLFIRTKAIGSILGLFLSFLIIIYYIIPRIASGANPILVSLIGSFLIILFSVYMAHGLNKRTSIAILSSTLILGIASVVALIIINLLKLGSVASEDAFYLQVSSAGNLDLKSILIAGIIITILGILDDITTAQVAVVGEINDANPSLTKSELYKKSIAVGREHIASLVNTLFLAYVGTSFAYLILIISSSNTEPAWVTINSQFIVEEIAKALIGSITLVLAIPISTLLGIYFLKNKN